MIAFPDTIQATSHTERLGDEIARLAAHLHAATYHLLVLIREFDEREGWGGGGFLSCAHWLSWRTGISAGPAREKVRVARALPSLPLISGAMAQGQLSYSKVRAMTRVASPENEADLLEVARHATATQVERIVRGWRRVDRLQEAEGAEEEQRHRGRYLRLYLDDDGTYVIRGRLDPEVGALLEKALEWAAEELYRDKATDGEAVASEAEAAAEAETAADASTFGQRRADALGLVAERAMADSDTGAANTPNRADRFQVVVHVEAPGLVAPAAATRVAATLADAGVGVPAGTSRRLACDTGVVLMTHDEEGRVLDVGRRRRTVPPAIRRALDYRDKGCRFPGCGCRYTDAHHITHWADGGETKLENLVNLCHRHHRAVHEGGFRVEALGNGDRDGDRDEIGNGTGQGSRSGSRSGKREGVQFVRPAGRVIPEVPEPPKVPADPLGELVQANETRGAAPEEWTATPLWNVGSLDYGLAIDMLRGGGPPPEDRRLAGRVKPRRTTF